MQHDEVKEKDWLLLTAHSSIRNMALLETIIEYQCTIISHLKNIPIEGVIQQAKANIDSNVEIISERVRKDIPNYPSIT